MQSEQRTTHGNSNLNQPTRTTSVAENDPDLLLISHSPIPFATSEITSCVRISSPIYSPFHNKTAIVNNILIPTGSPVCPEDMLRAGGAINKNSSSINVDKMEIETIDTLESNATAHITSRDNRLAYLLQRTIRDAIYGRVKVGVVLKPRRSRQHQDIAPSSDTQIEPEADWEITEEQVAIKEMDWSKIRSSRSRLTEDPIKEVEALHFLKDYNNTFQLDLQNVLLPLEILSDNKCLYTISPYCDGGDLFDLLDDSGLFDEEEAKYWMKQILIGLSSLQCAGVCHRDISLENLMVHNNGSLVIDLGMCLRIPFECDLGSENGHSNGISPNSRGRRILMNPQGKCGKWHYMSPEIVSNDEPFDGFAVDLWAVGIILFFMLTGFPPWERACDSDERFRFMSQGHMVTLLVEWDLGLSDNVMDLLQKMLHKDPRKRLTLRAVWEHPWFTEPPPDVLAMGALPSKVFSNPAA